MIPLPDLWPVETLSARLPTPAALWAGPHCPPDALAPLVPQVVDRLDAVPAGAAALVVAGGGSRIDRAKAWRAERRPDLMLVAIPTRWGSGAEASPIVVLEREDAPPGAAKDIRCGPQYLPTARCVIPALAASLSDDEAAWGCGDAFAHALEGLLSPLAGAELRRDLAAVLAAMLAHGPGRDPAWFDLGALACAGQALATVGLVHGLAHVLEPVLRAAEPSAGPHAPWGHARLCSLFLWPVVAYNLQASGRMRQRLESLGLDPQAVSAFARALFVPRDHARLRPLLAAHWAAVLRDPATRTNAALVSPAALAFFTGFTAI